jgi:hypothetical protein
MKLLKWLSLYVLLLMVVMLLFSVAVVQAQTAPIADLFPYASLIAIVLNAVVGEIVKKRPSIPNIWAPWINYVLGILINAGFPISVAHAAGVEVAAQLALPGWLAVATSPFFAPIWQQALAHWLTKTLKVHWLTARALASGTPPPGTA